MRKHDRIIADLAVQILTEHVERAKQDVTSSLASIEVRLALRCLLPYCRDRRPLLNFWDVAARPSNSRFANLHPALSGMLRQLKELGLSKVERY